MSDNTKSSGNVTQGHVLTSENLKDDVLDHIMDNMKLYFGNEEASAERFIEIANALNTFAHDVAKKSLANRQNLSPLKTFSATIAGDPDSELADDSVSHSLRYRLVEQYPNQKPHKDELFTLEEATEVYGEGFVSKYWGELGEHCPRKIQTSDQRMLWFSTVRFPDQAQSARINQSASESQGNTNKLDNALKM